MDRISIIRGYFRTFPVWIAGYEPTLDPDLIRIIEYISNFNAYIILMTNGSKLNEEYARELKKAKLNEVFLSVKTFDREKHIRYTGRSNEPVLNAMRNLAALEDDHFRLKIETILLPEKNDPTNIEELAIFISRIDPSISLFIEPWIPVEDTEFEEPRKEDLIEAVSRAMKHLYVVSYHPLHYEIEKIRKTPRKMKFVNVLPRK